MGKYNWKCKQWNSRFDALKEELHYLVKRYSAERINRESLRRLRVTTDIILKKSNLQCSDVFLPKSVENGAFIPSDLVEFFIYRNDGKKVRAVLKVQGWRYYLINSNSYMAPGTSFEISSDGDILGEVYA